MGGCTKLNCSKENCKKFFKSNALLLATVTAVILGIILGIALREANLSKIQIEYFAFPGTLLLRMLKMIILPLIICSLITGVATLDRRASGRLGLRAIAYYMATTLISVIIGIILVVAIDPGRAGKSTIDTSGAAPSLDPAESLTDLLRNIFPENLLQAGFQQAETRRKPIYAKRNVTETVTMATNPAGSTAAYQENTTVVEREVVVDYELDKKHKPGINVLGLICFCLTFGIIIRGMGDQGQILVDFFFAFNEAVMKIVAIVIWYSPIGIIFLIANKIMSMDDPPKILEQLGLYMATVITGLVIHGLIVLPLIYFAFVRKNPFRYMAGALQALMTALATSSSSATLPVTINCAEKNNNIDRRISRFVLPIGATINMDGTALYEAVAAIFIAQANGMWLNFGQIVTVSITATCASIGAAGVPQAGLVTLIIVLSSVGLPAENIELILIIDWLLDRIRTTVNVWGDTVGCGVISKLSEKDLLQADDLDHYALTSYKKATSEGNPALNQHNYHNQAFNSMEEGKTSASM